MIVAMMKRTSILLLLLLVGCGDQERNADHADTESQSEKSVPDASVDRDTATDATDPELVAEAREAAEVMREYYTAISRESWPRAYALLDEEVRPATIDLFRDSVSSIRRAVVTLGSAGEASVDEEGRPTFLVPISVEITIGSAGPVIREETWLLRRGDGGWRIVARMG